VQDCINGYPRVAAFLDSDDNFMICRRFGYLHWRVLLEKQNELQYLEKALDEMDKYENQANPGCLRGNDVNIACIAEGQVTERRAIMNDINNTLLEYKAIVASAREFASVPRPSNSEYRSFRYFFSNEQRLYDADQQWIESKEDMITLRPGREHAWLDRSLETIIRLTRCPFIQNLFRSKEARQKSDGPFEVYYTRSRIEYVANGIITVILLALLVVPIYVLYRFTNGATPNAHTTAVSICTLLVFTLAFSAVALFFTRARRHEILGAAAAYCAVLVVFFNNIQIVG